jgi:hypothetical protein
MRRLHLVLPLLAVTSLHAQQPNSPSTSSVLTEFRIFNGTEEITEHARLRVMPSGKRDKAISLEAGRTLVTELTPGIYDAQAFYTQDGSIVGIRWAERLVVMHYPDEGGRHLEVINFTSGYGALQLRAVKGPVSAYDVAVFVAGKRETPAAQPLEPTDYLLFVLPGGRYDIRVRRASGATPQRAGTRVGDPAAEDVRWFLDVEVPADRTRLKQIDVAG